MAVTVVMSDDVRSRIVSSIAFPYADLDNAIEVARAIQNAGAMGCTRDQLAAQLSQVPSSGAFGIKLAAARMFGLVDLNGQKYINTKLGFEILDTNEARAQGARMQAFLAVPLYKRTYEEFHGRMLPPRPHGLESAFVEFGVSVKQKDKARIVFERSAQQAGFLTPAKDRLVAPFLQDDADALPAPVATPASVPPASPVRPRAASTHPLLDGLFQEIPEPGKEWPIIAQVRWLQTAANVFGLLYKTKEDAPPEYIQVIAAPL